ncbi:MAG: NUDIX hydrolase [Candidatus Eremiobacteraeota bacterium]|nr:NUDIX hydrolase [Candidatus Eremiobacteraeota bacterium]MBV9408866.1 NUDIX hydrolase [Candidatus Eremiobacteraeota bacterium]
MSEERQRPWRLISSEYRIQTNFLRLRADRVELPNGIVVEDYFVRESRGFCIVFALTPDKHVLLVRQYKHGAGEVLVELPAGMIDEGESPEECAVRELVEETGYTGTAPELVRAFHTDPTNATGRFYLYLVRDAVRTHEQQFDVTEDIDVETASMDEVRAMALDGRIAAGAQVAAALVALAYLGR